MQRDNNYLVNLVLEQCRQGESEWVEFKHNKSNPEEIGEYISALSNSASLQGKVFAYLIWGIEDSTKDIVGTTFDYKTTKIGNENLEHWIARMLEPSINFSFHNVDIEGKRVVLLKIPQANHHPVRFKNQEFIRVGAYKKNLKEFPEKEKDLWQALGRTPFEKLIAKKHVDATDVLSTLDYETYFNLLDLPTPDDKDIILAALKKDNIVNECVTGRWNITNLGAILFARNINDFPTLSRKAVRVIQYKGRLRIQTAYEKISTKGYASGAEELTEYLLNIIPKNEIIKKTIRRTLPVYPELALRELVVNALIHQDFSITGAGPTIELFENRIEITNPGKSLVATDRFLDNPPKSRNEILASLLRRLGMCEERGSGIDKVVFETEFYQLPAPLFEVYDDFTKVTMFAPMPLSEMGAENRIRACYLHACLKYTARDFLTNASLRDRFGVEEKNRSSISRIIREAVGNGEIVPHDAKAAPKAMKYAPWWSKNTQK